MLHRLRLPNAPTQLGASNLRARGRIIASASLILPQLFLSDYSTALDVKELSRLGITHVLSVVGFEPGIPDTVPVLVSTSSDNTKPTSSAQQSTASSRRTLKKLHIALEDTPQANLLGRLEETTEWIKKAIEESKDNKVLVHCLQGVSRSSTVVCAYLIANADMNPSQAVKFVQSKRSVVLPNSGFRKQLDEFGLRFIGNRQIRTKTDAGAGDTAKRPSWCAPASWGISEGIRERIESLTLERHSMKGTEAGSG
ncbi:hypothetical protein D9758_012332 [Tetrapyrgos nigripes]|uniref:protein-tyrosine-phosphatase n=1 Tax=Tetrapyrgos nigripes TaxID=182062 RepID=A0A8H5CM00_9AGAR|nr:hypothetical protein D9758_012332 [Tetrapyrgos nigripes]